MLQNPFPEDFKSPVGDWLEHNQSPANQAGTNLRHIRDRELSRPSRLRRPASFKVGDLVLIHHTPYTIHHTPFDTPYFKSPVGDFLEHKQSMANQAGTNLRHIVTLERCTHFRFNRAQDT